VLALERRVHPDGSARLRLASPAGDRWAREVRAAFRDSNRPHDASSTIFGFKHDYMVYYTL
jgi:hypothetical protein